jgi:hypothetical protein
VAVALHLPHRAAAPSTSAEKVDATCVMAINMVIVEAVVIIITVMMLD